MRKVNLGDANNIKISIRLSEDLVGKIDKLSHVLNKDRSDVIRMILTKSLIYVEGEPIDDNKI